VAADSIEDKFFDILSSLLVVPRETLSRQSSRDTVQQWDSLKHMHLVLALEEAFGVEFDDDEVSGLADAASLLDAITSKGVA
jgi:acyl carrier protein